MFYIAWKIQEKGWKKKLKIKKRKTWKKIYKKNLKNNFKKMKNKKALKTFLKSWKTRGFGQMVRLG